MPRVVDSSASPTASLLGHPVAPDQFNPKWETDKLEVWSYYAYYISNNGFTPFNFAPTAFQKLLYKQLAREPASSLGENEQSTASYIYLMASVSFRW